LLLYNPEGGVNWPNAVPVQENGRHSGPSFLKPAFLTMGGGGGIPGGFPLWWESSLPSSHATSSKEMTVKVYIWYEGKDAEKCPWEE
jgi:hypothetical protein